MFVISTHQFYSLTSEALMRERTLKEDRDKEIWRTIISLLQLLVDL